MNNRAKFPLMRRNMQSVGLSLLVLGATVVAGGLALVSFLPTSGTVGSQPRAAWGAQMGSSRVAGGAADVTSRAAARAVARAQWGKLPLRFEVNVGQAGAGQASDDTRFIARGPGYGVLLGGAQTTLVLERASKEPLPARSTPLDRMRAAQRRSAERSIVRMEMAGGNRAAASEGLEKLVTETNYFIGNDPSKWHRKVANYARVRYRDVYPGVDMVYYGKESRLEYDLQVAAGRNPDVIRMRYTGAESMRLDGEGALVLKVKGSEIRQLRPKAYQMVAGVERPVEARYALSGNEVRFELGSYDRGRELVIDPTLVYSSYFGGSGDDSGIGITVDATGNVYLVGSTTSANLPTVPGSIGPVNKSAVGDAFVAKLDAMAHTIIYSDYIGGSNFDEATSIAVDATGNAYIGGDTASNDFPAGTTAGAQAAFNGAVGTTTNGWLAKLNPAGTTLLYSTYLGGNGSDAVNNLTIDGAGIIYATGFTNSSGLTPFPTTVGAFQRTFGGTSAPGNGTGDAIVVKLNPAVAGLAGLLYSTYVGGTGDEQGQSIAIDGAGNAFIAGDSNTPSGFPSPPSAGVIQPSPPVKTAGVGDSGFVAELNAAGSALTFFTYLGGNSPDAIVGMTRDAAGNIYVTGRTLSTNFPVVPAAAATPHAAQTVFGGGVNAGDAFVTKMNGSGTTIAYSTYLGGTTDDEGSDIRVDVNGFAYVVGLTGGNFPVTANAIQPAFAGTGPGAQNAFVAKVRPDGTQIVYASYHGGNLVSFANKMFLDTNTPPGVYFTGSTTSTNFPATPNSGANAVVQTANGGGQDAFVVKLDASVPIGDLSPTTLAFGNQFQNTMSAPQTVTYTNNGNLPLTIASIGVTGEYTQTNNCGMGAGNTFPNTLAPGASCTINVIFAPVIGPAGPDNGVLSALDNAALSPHTVTLTGTFVSAAANGSLTPPTLTFGNQIVTTTSASQPVTYKNIGNTPLTVNSITVTGEFTQTNNCGASPGNTFPSMLAAGATCTINVSFAPTTLPGGPRNGTLTANDNGTSNPESVTLTGASQAPSAVVAPNPLVFGNQNVGTSSASQTATLTNNGNSTLNITSITLLPQGPNDFSQTNNCGATLAPTMSCTFTVTFSPIGGSVAGQPRFGTILITDDAQPLFGPQTSTQSLSLRGTGITPAGGAFTLSAVTNSVTIHPGQTATFAILVIPAGGFNQPVALSCAGAPLLATCTVQPSTVTPNGQNSSSASVIVVTKAHGTLGPRPYDPRGTPPWTLVLLAAMMAALAAGMMTAPVRARMRYAAPMALVVLIVGLTVFASACGSGHPGTPTGTSILTVTGTGGGQTQTLNLTLNVVP